MNTVLGRQQAPTDKLSKLLASLETGARPRGGVRGIASGIPSIGGEHLDADGNFRFDRMRYVPEEFARTQAKGWIQPGDVLVVKDGATTGKVALVRDGFPPRALANEHVFVCRPSNELDPSFLYHFLASDEGRSQVLSDFRGAAQGGITRAFAEKVRIPLLSIDEQRAVVEQVDAQVTRILAAVGSLNAARDKAKHLVRAELSRLWYEAGTWEWRTLGSLSHASDYGTSQKTLAGANGPPVVRIPNVVKGDLDLADLKFATRPTELGDELRPGDLLIIRTNGSRPLIGRGAVILAPMSRATYHASYLIRFRLSGAESLWRWVNYAWAAPTVRRTLEALAATSAGQYNLNLQTLGAVRLPIPPDADMRSILNRLDLLSSQTDTLADEIAAAERRAATLRRAIWSSLLATSVGSPQLQ